MNENQNSYYGNSYEFSKKEEVNKNLSEERIMGLMARISEMRTAISICKKNCLFEAVKSLETEISRTIVLMHEYVDTLK
jgi:hypothetical protein